MAKKIPPSASTSREMSASKVVIRKVPRSAKTGLFVTEEFARKHPSTTEVETIKVEKSRRKKKP
jgi:hypothetical protein